VTRYLTVLKDVLIGASVGDALGDRMTQALTARALFRAVRQQRPPTGTALIHPFARGSHYGAHPYRAQVEPFGPSPSGRPVRATVTTRPLWRASKVA
jgi:putative transposase